MTQSNSNPGLEAAASVGQVLVIARGYLARGWAAIPIPRAAKAPVIKGWQHLRIAETDVQAQFGSHISNIGVLLGEPSHGLVDVDLDCEQAVRAAAILLPATATFGRQSRPASHYVFTSPGAKTAKYVDPVSKQMLLELRSTGLQTVFPGSQHPDGELVRWDSACEPVTVAATDQEIAIGREDDAIGPRCGGDVRLSTEGERGAIEVVMDLVHVRSPGERREEEIAVRRVRHRHRRDGQATDKKDHLESPHRINLHL